MTNKVTPAETPDQPDHFAAIAAELRRAAEDIETLVGSGLPKPGHFNLNIQPGTRGDDAFTAAAVDAFGLALVGRRGEVRAMSSGGYHYDMGGQVQRGPISVSIYQSVSPEWAVKREAAAALAEREAELERLRAEVNALRAAAASTKPDRWSAMVPSPHPAANCGPLTLALPPGASCPTCGTVPEPDADLSGYGYSREADDPTPVSPARGLAVGAPLSRIAEDGHKLADGDESVSEAR